MKSVLGPHSLQVSWQVQRRQETQPGSRSVSLPSIACAAPSGSRSLGALGPLPPARHQKRSLPSRVTTQLWAGTEAVGTLGAAPSPGHAQGTERPTPGHAARTKVHLHGGFAPATPRTPAAAGQFRGGRGSSLAEQVMGGTPPALQAAAVMFLSAEATS